MKTIRRITFFAMISTLISSCSHPETPKDLPFNRMPLGLQKKLETEVMKSMRKEVITEHQRLDKFFRSIPPMFHFHDLCNRLRIKRNNEGETMIQGEVSSEATIKKWVYDFYLANEGLSTEQTRHYVQNYKYEFYDFPFYSRVTKSQILEEITKSNRELQKALNHGEHEYAKFYDELVRDWEKRLQALTILEVDELREVHPATLVQIEDELNTEGLSSITEEALQGFITVRDFASRKYFGVSYMDLYFQGTRNLTPNAEAKLAAIDFLYEVRIWDESYARLNDLLMDWEWEEPEFELP